MLWEHLLRQMSVEVVDELPSSRPSLPAARRTIVCSQADAANVRGKIPSAAGVATNAHFFFLFRSVVPSVFGSGACWPDCRYVGFLRRSSRMVFRNPSESPLWLRSPASPRPCAKLPDPVPSNSIAPIATAIIDFMTHSVPNAWFKKQSRDADLYQHSGSALSRRWTSALQTRRSSSAIHWERCYTLNPEKPNRSDPPCLNSRRR
jgi:hypothetical protein